VESTVKNSDLLLTLVDEIRQLRQQVSSLQARLGEPLFKRADAAREWQVSPRTVTRWIAEGKAKPVNSTGHPRFTMDEINRVKREL
jgi:hypothetical protein